MSPTSTFVRLLAAAALCSATATPGRAVMGPADQITLDPACTVEDQTVLADPDDGRQVDIDVLVLLDGVDVTQATPIFADVQRPYTELNVRVVPTFQTVTPFTGDAALNIIGQARALFPDKKVPAEYDMVEVFTSKDIQVSGDYTVAGLAYCLGGSRDATLAYEVSEAANPAPNRVSQLQFTVKKAAKVTAHEMGHLFGGQHHYANCVEGIDPATERSDTSPCTLMFNDVTIASLHFGTLNARLVRAYALRYASANDVP